MEADRAEVLGFISSSGFLAGFIGFLPLRSVELVSCRVWASDNDGQVVAWGPWRHGCIE